MRLFFAFMIVLSTAVIVHGAKREIHRPFENDASLKPQGAIDRVVFSKLRQLGIQPANVCSDSVFLRRVYLDVIGTLPTLEETKQFLLSQSPHKRRELVDQLLQRDEFAIYWAMKWCDLLRVKAEFPVNLWPNAVQAYHRWVRTSFKDNMRYNTFVRELLCDSGSNFRVPQVNFYRSVQGRKPEAIARAVALTFMGVRAEKWPKERLEGMTPFFAYVGYKKTAEWKEEIVFFDFKKMVAEIDKDGPRSAIFPDGTKVALTPDKDPREVFADWLISPKNPWFTRSIANRVWFWLMGRGVIHEPDDIRPDNPPTSARLMTILEKEVMSSRYDLRELFRRILNSKTYQLSSIWKGDFEKGQKYFAFYRARQIDAEVLVDAICQITGTTEEYSSAIPEPFTFVPPHRRTVALADGSITSPFLELFGRPPRDTGLQMERNNRPSWSQRLFFLNSSHLRQKIERGPKMQQLMRASRDPREVVTRLYLTILSRMPTQEELAVANKYSKSSEVDSRTAVIDLAWALFNSVEFLYRH